MSRLSPGASPAHNPPAPATTATALLELVVSTPSIEAYLDQVVKLVDALSPAIAGCGITVRRDGNALSVATSNHLAAAVDEVQYGLGTGPCLDTLDTGEPVDVPDMVETDRWDGYPEHALSHGVRSSLSLPLTVDGSTVGVLNSYGSEPGMFTGERRAQLVDLAAHAQVALAVAFRAAEQMQLVEQLHTAMQSRSVIDQALGILMARQKCTSDDAFAILRAASQSRNRRIADIAAELITATTGSTPRPGRFKL